MAWSGAAEFSHDDRQKQDQKGPEVGEDLAEVVAAGAEDGEYGIAGSAFERAAGEAAVGFHVSDLGLDGASSAQEFGQSILLLRLRAATLQGRP